MIHIKEGDYLPVSSERVALKSKKYDSISYENRKELIKKVIDENQKVSEAAEQMSIKLSTAKFIVRSFKRHGKIFKKKPILGLVEVKKSDTFQKQAKPNPQIQFLYYPIYVYVPVSTPLASLEDINPSKEGFKPVCSDGYWTELYP